MDLAGLIYLIFTVPTTVSLLVLNYQVQDA